MISSSAFWTAANAQEDTMVGQPSIRKEPYRADGQMSSALHIPTSSCAPPGEAALTNVSPRVKLDTKLMLMSTRFMFDKIMPLTEALEGYEIFDKMQAQKVVFSIPDAQ